MGEAPRHCIAYRYAIQPSTEPPLRHAAIASFQMPIELEAETLHYALARLEEWGPRRRRRCAGVRSCQRPSCPSSAIAGRSVSMITSSSSVETRL